MVKLTGTVKEFARQRMRVGAIEIDGTEFFGKFDTGNRWYVDSAASAGGDGTSPEGAFDTLDEAFAACTANQGDVIYVLPNHAETITGAGGIAHDVAGVSVVGLGEGNQRPRFLMDAATTVTYAITADDAHVENLVFAAGHADIVACITTTKKHTHIIDCEFVNNTADENFLTEIKATSTTDNDSDGLTVIGCRAMNIDTAGVEFVEINADLNEGVFADNFVSKDAATAAKFIFVATGKDLRDVQVYNNRCAFGTTSGDLLIDNDTAVNSGVVYNNIVGHHVPLGTALRLVDCDGVREWGNRTISQDGDPIVDYDPVRGYRITKSATLASDPDVLFTVTGLNEITMMVGVVTSVFATATSMSINTSDATHTAVLVASSDVVTRPVGVILPVSGDPDDGLAGDASGASHIGDAGRFKTGIHVPIIVNGTSIYMNLDQAGTGLIDWTIYYRPLESGASITSAA